MTVTTDIDADALGVDLQARALGILTDGRVWSRGELAEQLADEVESGTPDFTLTMGQALDALVRAGLAHRVNRELVSATRRGMAARQGVDPGDGHTLRVPNSGGVGVVERVDDPDATDRLAGGAEKLPGGLDVIGARRTY